MRFPTPYQQVYHDIFEARVVPAADPDEDRTSGFFATAREAIGAGELVTLDEDGMALPMGWKVRSPMGLTPRVLKQLIVGRMA